MWIHKLSTIKYQFIKAMYSLSPIIGSLNHYLLDPSRSKVVTNFLKLIFSILFTFKHSKVFLLRNYHSAITQRVTAQLMLLYGKLNQNHHLKAHSDSPSSSKVCQASDRFKNRFRKINKDSAIQMNVNLLFVYTTRLCNNQEYFYGMKRLRTSIIELNIWFQLKSTHVRIIFRSGMCELSELSSYANSTEKLSRKVLRSA